MSLMNVVPRPVPRVNRVETWGNQLFNYITQSNMYLLEYVLIRDRFLKRQEI